MTKLINYLKTNWLPLLNVVALILVYIANKGNLFIEVIAGVTLFVNGAVLLYKIWKK